MGDKYEYQILHSLVIHKRRSPFHWLFTISGIYYISNNFTR